MTEAKRALLAAHHRNLERYRRITTTPLTDIERAYVKRRMTEVRLEIERLERERESEPPLSLSGIAWLSGTSGVGKAMPKRSESGASFRPSGIPNCELFQRRGHQTDRVLTS
jgi:hypothetical protein